METAQPHEGEQGQQGPRGPRPLHGRINVSGIVRRVRRRANWSQRQLARELGVSQSAVAKWETQRTTPSPLMLAGVMALAELRLEPVDETGERVAPMRHFAARDAARRRYPAHATVWAEGWWTPADAGMTPWSSAIIARSAELGLPQVRHSSSRLVRSKTPGGLDDHPTWDELVADASNARRPPPRPRVSIPEWALKDSRKSRNRRPQDF
ncbi:helix-turn-helix domain-containing protein [Nocardioides sp. B-3]|uniref:helix-turn-helix domain-containing protein n=1 Tax=Nocardioides sp. B-3 TaxID=2895565 RepID=UPI002152A2D7|nr:helix-turn-helix transcriptional regulator [Nocardioides sp. B-3]UUZ61171.1 helix-turn-helix domain-containing protein [Nocardioides sp. B-3]